MKNKKLDVTFSILLFIIALFTTNFFGLREILVSEHEKLIFLYSIPAVFISYSLLYFFIYKTNMGINFPWDKMRVASIVGLFLLITLQIYVFRQFMISQVDIATRNSILNIAFFGTAIVYLIICGVLLTLHYLDAKRKKYTVILPVLIFIGTLLYCYFLYVTLMIVVMPLFG